MSAPTLHLTNASSRKYHHGRVFNIMANPRRFERLDGHVAALTPTLESLSFVQRGQITAEEYRGRFEARVVGQNLTPGNLIAWTGAAHGNPALRVEDGDTLVCACSKAAAARGQCHRAWAAPHLIRAGWRVVLDGVEFRP